MKPGRAAAMIFWASLALALVEGAVLLVTRPPPPPPFGDHGDVASVAEVQELVDKPLYGWLLPSSSVEFAENEIATCKATRSAHDCELSTRFEVTEWREMVWWLLAGLGVGLIGLAGSTRRVLSRRSLTLVLLACVAWMPVGAPSAIVFTGWQLLAYILVIRAHARTPIA